LPTDQPSSLDRDLSESNRAAASIFTIVSPPESHEPERGRVTIISPPPESHESEQGREVNALRQKIQHLETQLSKATATAREAPVRPSPNAAQADNTPESTTTSSLVRTNISVHEESSIPSADSRTSTTTTTTTIIRHIMYKTRLFGRSHWMTGAIQVSEY
jgi:hypothetical protein